MGYYPGFPPTGSAGNNEIELEYSDTVLPPLLIAHEASHRVQRASVPFEDDDDLEAFGVFEGFPTLFGALVLKQSRQYLEVFDTFAWDVDVFIHRPLSMITYRDVYESRLNSAEYAEAFPVYYPRLEGEFNDSIEEGLADEQHPYFSFAVYGQPVWQAAQWFGWPTLQKVTLMAYAQFEEATYDGMATSLVKVACEEDEPLLAAFLSYQFKLRGLNVDKSTIKSCKK